MTMMTTITIRATTPTTMPTMQPVSQEGGAPVGSDSMK